MDIVLLLIDFILHIDVHLANLVQNHGNWVYAVLFLIIFVETGFVVMPFLPGDSLLFVVGALAATGAIDLSLCIGLLLIAAILGDQCNYTIGRYFGPKVFQWEDSRFFSRKSFDRAHAFYERYGAITVARLSPVIPGGQADPRERFEPVSALPGQRDMRALEIRGRYCHFP